MHKKELKNFKKNTHLETTSITVSHFRYKWSFGRHKRTSGRLKWCCKATQHYLGVYNPQETFCIFGISHLILRKNVSNSQGRHMNILNTWLYNLYNNCAELVVEFWTDHQWQYVMPWRCTLIGMSRKYELVDSIRVSGESRARHGTLLSTVSFPTSCPRGCYLIEHTCNRHN